MIQKRASSRIPQRMSTWKLLHPIPDRPSIDGGPESRVSTHMDALQAAARYMQGCRHGASQSLPSPHVSSDPSIYGAPAPQRWLEGLSRIAMKREEQTYYFSKRRWKKSGGQTTGKMTTSTMGTGSQGPREMGLVVVACP